MTGIFKFRDGAKGSGMVNLSREERERIARNAAAAAERMKQRGDDQTVVKDIRRRNAARVAA